MSTEHTSILLLRNLLARIDADAEAERPLFRGLVPDAEREALRSLLGDPVVDPKPVEYRIDTTVLELSEAQEPAWILCLDFGTAMSKAFACRTVSDSILDELEIDDLDPLDLPLGEADRSAGEGGPTGYGIDGSVYAVVSSVWIDDTGLMYAGAGALDRGKAAQYAGTARERLDSIKQQISQIPAGYGLESTGHAPEMKLLGRAVNPTSVKPTYLEAITFYLGYLTDLAVIQLEERIGARYVKRRFTLPWWKEERQRNWGAELIAHALVRAQMLADTFRGRWNGGIHVEEVKAVLGLAAQYDDRLMWLLDRNDSENVAPLARWGSGLEALAAASGRVWADRSARELMLVVDVGAGTTDLSLFLVVQAQKRKAFPVLPCGVAVKQAGDSLDSRLLEELLNKAHVGEDPRVRERMRDGLRLRGVRQIKERLFQTGLVRETLDNDETVDLTLEQFLGSDAVKSFERTICNAIQTLLDDVHDSWYSANRDAGITLVLTGGGCNLPMIQNLKNKRWTIGGRSVKCRLAKEVPDFVAQRFRKEFAREYPQLAVAMGGAMPLLLDERRALKEFGGDAPPPGRVERPRGADWTG